MKILLLGAAGFIGTNLTIELAKKTEDEITLVDRSKAFFKPIVSMNLKNVHILEADLTVDMDFDSILKDQEVVYHLVSTTVPTTSNQHISQELVSNVIFSANLFEACISHGQSCTGSFCRNTSGKRMPQSTGRYGTGRFT